MTTLAQNIHNDLFVRHGDFAVASGEDCRRVILHATILTQKGEIQTDSSHGIDYFGTVFRDPKYLQFWAAQVRSAITKYPWVAAISDFTYSFDRAAGAVNWTMTVETTFGEAIRIGVRGASETEADDHVNIAYGDLIGAVDVSRPKHLAAEVKAIAEKMRGLTGYIGDDASLAQTKSRLNEIIEAIQAIAVSTDEKATN